MRCAAKFDIIEEIVYFKEYTRYDSVFECHWFRQHDRDLFTLLPMILIIVFMFILIYLPQKRQDKKDAAMRSSIEIGDKVSTIGGIVGIVCAISEKDDTIVLETGSDRTKIRFRRTAIASVEKLDMGGKDTTPAKK